MRDEQGIQATELHGADAREALADTLAGDFELQPLVESEQQRTQRLLGSPYVLSLKNAAERRCVEAERVKADIAFNAYKASGQMRRDEDHRALQAQVHHGDAR